MIWKSWRKLTNKSKAMCTSDLFIEKSMQFFRRFYKTDMEKNP